jgi:hypothetical protein
MFEFSDIKWNIFMDVWYNREKHSNTRIVDVNSSKISHRILVQAITIQPGAYHQIHVDSAPVVQHIPG